MNPVSVWENIHQELRRTNPLPFPVTFSVKLLSLTHRMWWFYRKRQWVKPENIVPAALGVGLQLGLKVGPNILEELVQGIAKVILIATRLDECIKTMKSLASSYINLKDAIALKYAPVNEPQWIKKPKSIIFSAGTSNQWKTNKKEWGAYLMRICHCLGQIFRKTFKLNMRLWNIYDAFAFSHDAIPELFVNGMYWYRQVRENKEYIITKLEEYEPLIQNICDITYPDLTAEDFIDRTKQILEGFEKVETHVSKAGEKVVKRGKKVIEIFKSKLLGREFASPQPQPLLLKKKLILNK